MRELILNNFWLKVFSLVLGSLIWFVLDSNLQSDSKYPQNIKYPQNLFRPTQTRDFHCPVTLLVGPSNMQSYQVEPTEVLIKVQGDASTINELDPRGVQAYVDLAALRDQEDHLEVKAIVPKEVTLRSIFPSNVYVRPSG